jgi:hypothetical protein
MRLKRTFAEAGINVIFKNYLHWASKIYERFKL